jgi:hypothetical protein
MTALHAKRLKRHCRSPDAGEFPQVRWRLGALVFNPALITNAVPVGSNGADTDAVNPSRKRQLR